MLQLGAIGVWTYVYMIMRMSATRSKGDINLCNSTTSIKASQEALETSSRLLLPTKGSPRSGIWSDDKLPYEEKSKVFLNAAEVGSGLQKKKKERAQKKRNFKLIN